MEIKSTRGEIAGVTDYVKPYTELLEECMALRASAYKQESDNLKSEAEYDAMSTGTTPDYSAWMAKVADIKKRYPKPIL